MKLFPGSARVAVSAALALTSLAVPAASAAASKPLHVTWMPGFAARGTPANYNRVGVIKIGPASAKNVLVLEPGTQAGGGYFIPMAQWLLTRVKGWQVWSNRATGELLEDQSVLELGKLRKATDQQVYDYYFGFLTNAGIKHHFQSVPDANVQFASSGALRLPSRTCGM